MFTKSGTNGREVARRLVTSRVGGIMDQEYSLICSRTRPVLVGLACALAAGIAAADGTSGGRFAVWAIGLADGYVIMEHQAPTIHVTADDVAQGVVQVRGGSRLVIATDSPAGYIVDFHTRSAWFKAVEIDGIGSAVELGPAGGTVVQRDAAAGRRVIAVNYRFVLAPDATPGTYAWPLDMIVRAPVSSDLESPGGASRFVTIGGRAEP